MPAGRVCLTPGCPYPVASRGRCSRHTKSTAARGYGSAWRRASRAAISAQPWCTDCGATQDLTGDHPTADRPWIDVVCRACNTRRMLAQRYQH
jgi:hypothetical protein